MREVCPFGPVVPLCCVVRVILNATNIVSVSCVQICWVLLTFCVVVVCVVFTFNDYFINVCTTLAKNIANINSSLSYTNFLKGNIINSIFINLTTTEVESLLRLLHKAVVMIVYTQKLSNK